MTVTELLMGKKSDSKDRGFPSGNSFDTPVVTKKTTKTVTEAAGAFSYQCLTVCGEGRGKEVTWASKQ